MLPKNMRKLNHPKLSAGIAFSAVVLLAASTYGIHRYRHSGQQTQPDQQTPSGQLSEPPISEDNPRLGLFFDQEANQEHQHAAPHQVDQEPVALNQVVPIPGANQGPAVRARANSDPQLPHQEIIGRPRSG